MVEPRRLREITDELGVNQDDRQFVGQAPQAPQVQEARVNEREQAANKLLLGTIRLALQTLAQKTLIALAALRGLLLSAAVFGLMWHISDHPTINQIGLTALFAIFVIVLEVARLRKGS